MLGINHKILALFPMTLLVATMFVVSPVPIFADPPPPPPPDADNDLVLPKVFCIRITDIRADKSDPTPDENGEPNRFTFEFEVLNWSDRLATNVHFAIGQPDDDGVIFVSTPIAHEPDGDGVDDDGRPLIMWPPGGPFVPNEDTLGPDAPNGILEPGEDVNGDGRLTNDPIPGNANIDNEFERTELSPTSITWEAPECMYCGLEVDFEIPSFVPLAHAGEGGFQGISNNDLLFWALFGQEDVNERIPGVFAGTTTIDDEGNISPAEAIDNGFNVRDGFVFTVDDFDDGDVFVINWFLSTTEYDEDLDELVSVPIGRSDGLDVIFGNAFGFGVLNFARADDGGLPGPVFEGNTGFLQSPLMFYDSVYIVPDPAGVGAEPGAGITAPFSNDDDNIFDSVPNTQLIQVGGMLMPVDTTSLMILGIQGTASWLIPVLVSAIGIGIVLVTRKSK